MSQPVPLMILGDHPSGQSGLGRILRDLAQRIHANMSDVFRVATIGYGGVGSRHLPWQQYAMIGDPPNRGWFVPELYLAWKGWAGDEHGVLLTIWDATRMRWLVDPKACPDPALNEWLRKRTFQLWGYWPADSEGVNHKLPFGFAEVMRRYDRNLAYGNFGAGLMARDGITAEALPHGIDRSVWYPRDRKEWRQKFCMMGLTFLRDDSLLLGVVATNQPRKNWTLAFETCAELLTRGHDVFLWGHTNTVKGYWNLLELTKAFGMTNRVLITNPGATDDELAGLYSGCDATLAIGLGEGYGYATAESLACGVPCVHGNYGGGAELLPVECLVEPESYFYDGLSRWPTFNPLQWADRVTAVVGKPTALPDYLDWTNLWSRWEQWLREGVR